jgi:hypothetical protein
MIPTSSNNHAYADPVARFSQTIASENHVYVIWNRVSNGTASIMFGHSSDYGNTFGKAIPVTDNAGFDISRISNSYNNVYLAWGIDAENHHGIFLKKSTDHGNTFESTIMLSSPDKLCNSLRGLESAGSNVYVFFSCYDTASQEGSIVFRASHDNATSFGKPIILFQGKGVFSNGPFWASIQGKNVYAITEDNYPISTPDSVLFRRSTDGGDTFSDIVNLSNNKNSHVNPQVFSNQNHVYVTWRDYYDNYFNDLTFRKSDDYGATFGNLTKLNTNKPDTDMFNNPFLEVVGNKIYVSWEEIHQGQVQTQYQLLRTSTDSGDRFDPEQKLTDVISMGYNLQQGGIALGSGQNVYYLYPGTSNPTFDIAGVFFKKSSDGAKTFGSTLDLNKLNPSSHDMYDPQITVAGDNVYVTADTQDRGNEIFFVSSHDNGTTFRKTININNYDSNVSKTKVVSPLKQLHSGMAAQNVKCQDGFELITNSQKSPACVRYVSLPRLLSHGWVFGVSDTSEIESKKTQEIIMIGNKIPNRNGLVPVIVTEITNHAESLDSITIWTFRPVDRYYGDNSHITLDIPQNFTTSKWIVDEQNNDIIDKSRMPDNFAIAGTGLSLPVICSPTEKVVGDGDSPYSIPIKKGNPVVLVKGSKWGMFPDSNGEYSLKYASPFETKVEFPKNAQIISNETKSCFVEHKMYNFTKAFYTKAVFKLD